VLHREPVRVEPEPAGRGLRDRAAALVQGGDPDQHLGDGEGLRHVVVAAGVEPRHPVVHRVQGGEEQDRSVLAGRPQRLAHVTTVRVGEPDVDHQHVEVRADREVAERLLAVAGDDHLVPVHLERLGEDPAHRLLVLADPDPGH
jgi:hypothetical protein